MRVFRSLVVVATAKEHKRYCYPQKRYKNSGAFTVNGEPI